MKPAAPPHDEETHAEPCGGDPMPAKTRSALDAFGYASLLVAELNGRCTWHSALARSLMSVYFSGAHFERGWLPPEILLWLHREALRRRAGAPPRDLSVLAQPGGMLPQRAGASAARKRLCLTLHSVDPDTLGEGQWLIVLREADAAALMDALMRHYGLSLSEAELVFAWLQGEAGTELVSLMTSSPELVQGGMAALWRKLGVADAEQACALVRRQLTEGLL